MHFNYVGFLSFIKENFITGTIQCLDIKNIVFTIVKNLLLAIEEYLYNVR